MNEYLNLLLASPGFYDQDLWIVYGALFFIWSLDQLDDMAPYSKWRWGGATQDKIWCICYTDESTMFITCTKKKRLIQYETDEDVKSLTNDFFLHLAYEALSYSTGIQRNFVSPPAFQNLNRLIVP